MALLALSLATQAFAYTPAFYPSESYGIGSWPQSVAIGDVDSDGLNELLVTTNYRADPGRDFKLFVYRHAEDGSLRPTKLDTSASTGTSMGLGIGDLNGDSRNDVAVAAGTGGVEAFFQSSDGGLLPAKRIADAYGADHLRIADVDRDRREDVVVNRWAGVDILYRRGDGYEEVPLPSSRATAEVEVGDVNADGLLDVVTLGWLSIGIHEQLASGGFSARTIQVPGYIGSWGIAVGDVTGDDADDVVITRAANKPRSTVDVFQQLPGQGIVSTPVSLPVDDVPEAVEIADVNRDGRGDVVIAHGNTAGVVPQTASGSLGSEVVFQVPYQSHSEPQSIGAGDVNGDRHPDIALAGLSGAVLLRQISHNVPPDCSSATATPNVLASSDGALRTIELGGVADADSDPVSIAVTRVRQDEPVTDAADKTSPDAAEGGLPRKVELRAERNAKGDGRVYEISFRASDGAGGACSGSVNVSVPRSKQDEAISSSPPWFDSIGTCLTAPRAE